MVNRKAVLVISQFFCVCVGVQTRKNIAAVLSRGVICTLIRKCLLILFSSSFPFKGIVKKKINDLKVIHIIPVYNSYISHLPSQSIVDHDVLRMCQQSWFK